MEDLVTQRFQYAEIVLYKNYSKIDERDKHLNVENRVSYGDPFLKLSPPTFFDIPLTPKKNKKNTKYFYNDGDGFITIRLEPAYKLKTEFRPSFQTTKDRHIKNHFANPFASIHINTIERSVRRHGNKITIKIYRHVKYREVFCKFFSKNSFISSLTFDMSTGNFVILDIEKTRNTNIKRFRKNSFLDLNNFLINRKGIFDNTKLHLSDKSPIYYEHVKSFNDVLFRKTVVESFGFEDRFVHQHILVSQITTFDFVELFVKLKKIKVPNTYYDLICHIYPTEKFLKKNDRKLISSILDVFGIKSKITIKILHTIPDIDVMSLSKLCYFFGDNFQKYLGTIDEKCFSKAEYHMGDYNIMIMRFKEEYINYKNHGFNISEVEKENIVKIINGRTSTNGRRSAVMTINNEFSQLLWDHFNMIKRISDFDPNIKMLATNYSDFNDEHAELTKIIQAINKGWVIEYQFNPEMKDDIEKPITIKINLTDDEKDPSYAEETFYPVILKREEEYIEEGNFMHHCVATYSDRDKSVIISIRTKDKSDRITCEFDAQTGICIQARHFCNGQIPGDMELALEKLKKKTKFYANLGMLYCTNKEKVPVIINGVSVDKLSHQTPLPIMFQGDLEF